MSVPVGGGAARTSIPAAPVVPTPGAIGRYRPLGGADVALSDGFWAAKLRTNREATLPHAFRQLVEVGTLENFRLASGAAQGRYRALGIMFDGPFPFLDSDAYKWLEGVGWELGRSWDAGIAGLPGETHEMTRQSIDECARLRPGSIKFHHCYVYENTVLAREWREGRYVAPELETHVGLAADCLERMPPTTAIQRLVGEISSPGVLAPHQYSDVIWRWEGNGLVSAEVPRFLYAPEMAKKAYYRALALLGDAGPALAGIARCAVTEIGRLDEWLAAGQESGAWADLLRSDELAAQLAGPEALDVALGWAIGKGDMIAASGHTREHAGQLVLQLSLFCTWILLSPSTP